jgi:hypothetical protein
MKQQLGKGKPDGGKENPHDEIRMTNEKHREDQARPRDLDQAPPSVH